MLILLNSVLLGRAYGLSLTGKRALACALEVGRDEKPSEWACTGCDASNKPQDVYYIEEKSKDVKVLIARYNDSYLLSFRYTNTLNNLISDINYAAQVEQPGTCSGCKVHKEFKTLWDVIRYNVTNDLRYNNAQFPRSKLIISGISLGGALTLISWVDLKAEFPHFTMELLTFGSPRVGNKNWASWINNQLKGIHSRYQIDGDPIRNLPACLTLLCNYGNTERLYECYDSNKTCQNKPIPKSDNEQEERLNLWSAPEDLTEEEVSGIDDHINGYKHLYDYTVIG